VEEWLQSRSSGSVIYEVGYTARERVKYTLPQDRRCGIYLKRESCFIRHLSMSSLIGF
jgi:hypothetical protein